MRLVDVLFYGFIGVCSFGGLAWLALHLVWPRELEALRHSRASRLFLEHGEPVAARAAYATLRELALRHPERPALREIQFGGARTFLYGWLDRLWKQRSWPVATPLDDDERALIEQMWTDLQAAVSELDVRPHTTHMLVRTLSPFVRLLDKLDDPARAAIALRLMQRFREHCKDCTETCSSDWHFYFQRLISK